MESGMTKSYIWPLANRISHLFLIILFPVSYILGDFEELLSIHVAFGLTFGLILLFRFIWGFLGPKYSRFSDFNFSRKELKDYLFAVFVKTKEYIGHNPASSYAIVLIILLSFLTILSGMLTYGIQENHGVFSFLHSSFFKEMELFEEFHETFSNLLLIVILIHISGALIDKFIKKSDTIDSMFHGYKKTKSPLHVKTNIFQKIYSFIWLFFTLFAFYTLVFSENNIFIDNANSRYDYALIHPDFYNECSSCHIAYPPYLLPRNSWKLLMGDLENHFGDDASLDSNTAQSIYSFLNQNSAEASTHQAAHMITKSLKEKDDTIAISNTPYWKKRHSSIDENIFTSQEIKSKANCQACHMDIENGLMENHLIKLPKQIKENV